MKLIKKFLLLLINIPLIFSFAIYADPLSTAIHQRSDSRPSYRGTELLPLTFQSGEHIFMGDQVVLKEFPKITPDQPVKLSLDNGLQLTYGEILAMPDFYGETDHPISSEVTFEQRKNRFQQIFSEFSHYSIDYFNAFWPIIQKEHDQVVEAVKAHQDVSQLYKKILDQENIELTLATQMRYLLLTESAKDHFNTDAILAYQAGHSVAIDTAIYARTIRQPDVAQKTLMLAYEQNAYACHFLSDRFSAGHMRTPFRALMETRPITTLAGISADLMHNEDSQSGVIVTNKTGATWIAYGDDYYFSPQNQTNRNLLTHALQVSADEIDSAYQLGVDTDVMSQKVIDLIPEPIAAGESVMIEGVGFTQQTAPLYRVFSGMVYQRIDVNNREDNQWTPIWSTVITLLTYHADQSFKLPVKWQLILHHNHLDDILQQLGIAPLRNLK